MTAQKSSCASITRRLKSSMYHNLYTLKKLLHRTYMAMDGAGSDNEYYETANATDDNETPQPSKTDFYDQDQENINQSNDADGYYDEAEIENVQNQSEEILADASEHEEIVYDEQPQEEEIQYVDDPGEEQVYEISTGEVQEVVSSDDIKNTDVVEEETGLEEGPHDAILPDAPYEEYVQDDGEQDGNKDEVYQGEDYEVEPNVSEDIYIHEDDNAQNNIENLDENEQMDDSEVHEEEDIDGTTEQPSDEIVEDDGVIEEHPAEQEEINDQYEDDDNDYEDAVEVEEEKVSEDGENENVAQHESDSDNEQDEGAVEEDVKLGHLSDYDVRDSDEDVGEEEPVGSSKTVETQADKPSQEAIAKMFDSDSEEEGGKGEVGNLIADIFGESDDENEEFTGFGEEETSKSSKKKSLNAVISDSDEDDSNDAETTKPPEQQEGSSSDEGVADDGKESGMVYDFDVMLQRKKDERKGRRKRDGGTFISDSDDIINAMLTKMREAALADRDANHQKKPALNKLKMLPVVVRHLKKQDLKEAFVDMGIIAAIADWLTLLPDRSLPHISIRQELLKVLHDLPSVSPETLKTSGIGRAVMMLFKHPRETRVHKESAGRLINKWSRPIFGLNENFKSMSRGEREQRDLEQMPQSKKRRLSAGRPDPEKIEEAAPEPGQLRPGERGFVMRARVPMPSNKDYVIRPKWNVESNDDEVSHRFNKRAKPKKDERLEKHLKTFADRRKNMKMQRAVGISIEGNKMPLS